MKTPEYHLEYAFLHWAIFGTKLVTLFSTPMNTASFLRLFQSLVANQTAPTGLKGATSIIGTGAATFYLTNSAGLKALFLLAPP
ncbi:hypothetical protein V5799_031182 [Amblyomma americanum]|uniref:Uncharacterized protein n=1 Tax=Amblyomma americanum TaxID=6943 RepID=A0AAQ4EL36_AMBAM